MVAMTSPVNQVPDRSTAHAISSALRMRAAGEARATWVLGMEDGMVKHAATVSMEHSWHLEGNSLRGKRVSHNPERGRVDLVERHPPCGTWLPQRKCA